MSHLSATTLYLGEVKQNSVRNLQIKELETSPGISSVQVSCPTCLSAQVIGDTINIKYRVGDIPNHLMNSQEISQWITVHFKKGSSEKVYIKGTKVK